MLMKYVHVVHTHGLYMMHIIITFSLLIEYSTVN